jgi:hypothetical protein
MQAPDLSLGFSNIQFTVLVVAPRNSLFLYYNLEKPNVLLPDEIHLDISASL